jgi:hypothetical protein
MATAIAIPRLKPMLAGTAAFCFGMFFSFIYSIFGIRLYMMQSDPSGNDPSALRPDRIVENKL